MTERHPTAGSHTVEHDLVHRTESDRGVSWMWLTPADAKRNRGIATAALLGLVALGVAVAIGGDDAIGVAVGAFGLALLGARSARARPRGNRVRLDRRGLTVDWIAAVSPTATWDRLGAVPADATERLSLDQIVAVEEDTDDDRILLRRDNGTALTLPRLPHDARSDLAERIGATWRAFDAAAAPRQAAEDYHRRLSALMEAREEPR